ncbi:hypothetical protein DV735_g2748, partial [Chaetothyriales sp. CBS 134920]
MLGDLVELATSAVDPDHEPDLSGGQVAPQPQMAPRRRAASKSEPALSSAPSSPAQLSPAGDSPSPSWRQWLENIGWFVVAVALTLGLELALNTAVALQTAAKTELAAVSQPDPTDSQIAWLVAEKLALLAVFWFGQFDAYDVASLTLLSATPVSTLLALFYNIHPATLATETAIRIAANTAPYLAILATTLELSLLSFLPTFLITRFGSLRTLEFAHESAVTVVLPTLLVALLPAGYAARRQVLFSRASVLAAVTAVETAAFAIGQLQGDIEWEGALGYAGLWVGSLALVAAALDW